MGIISFKRIENWYDRKFNYKVLIDDQPMFEIANGELKEFETSNGKTTIKAQIMWCGSPTILINNPSGKQTNIQISPNKKFHKILFTAIVVCISVSIVAGLFPQNLVIKTKTNFSYALNRILKLLGTFVTFVSAIRFRFRF